MLVMGENRVFSSFSLIFSRNKTNSPKFTMLGLNGLNIILMLLVYLNTKFKRIAFPQTISHSGYDEFMSLLALHMEVQVSMGLHDKCFKLFHGLE